MTKYQNAVMWLGLALVFVRFLTTGQRSLFHNILTSGGNALPVNNPPTSTTPQNSNQAPKPNPQPNAPAPTPSAGAKPTPVASSIRVV